MMEKTAGGTIVTGPHISIVGWLSVKGCLFMESKGMTSRGGAIRPKVAAQLGLRPLDSYETFISAVNAKVAELKAEAARAGN